MSEQRERLAALVRELAVVHGRVTLSSGKEADYYVDLRRATLHHEAGPLIGSLMRELTADLDFASVGGLTLGADLTIPGALLSAVIHQAGLGGRAEGRFFGWWTCASKLTLALASGIALPSLAWMGFQTGSTSADNQQLLAIAYGGQAAANHVRRIARHAHRVQQVFGVVVIAVALAMLWEVDGQITVWLTQFYPSGWGGL